MHIPPWRTITTISACLWVSAALGVAQTTLNHSGSGLIKVTLSPTSSTLQVDQTQQFSASVSGTDHRGLIWLVNGRAGGNATVGTITSSGLYTAPSSAPSGPVTITARSTALPSAYANARISITGTSSIAVSISPTSTSMQVNRTQQFGALVSGTSNTAVHWMVNGTLGGNSTVGWITGTGVYTAPARVPSGSISVTAQSAAQHTVSASAAVLVSGPVLPVSHSVSLAWAGTSSVIGYYVYRGAQATGPFSKLNSSPDPATAYTDSTVASGQTYYYVTTAVDSSGIETAYSNVAQATIP